MGTLGYTWGRWVTHVRYGLYAGEQRQETKMFFLRSSSIAVLPCSITGCVFVYLSGYFPL